MVDGLMTQVARPRLLEHFASERVTLGVGFWLQSETERIVRKPDRCRTKHNVLTTQKTEELSSTATKA